ncbi:DNA internalization-related competence protein ComEC/Rec2 [Paenibacillus fonticola]|uniref:DNA internalization-related competence protein ComEC/Rec2 n=1 Tax=Paenibacillus fonticola TaxID=379896 RepID=UPI00037E7302|nr:DNA internalization-related competence protein ComEC/Rec2 [Paenibacillus fonticola]
MTRRPLVHAVCCWIAGSSLSCLYKGTVFWLLWTGVSLMIPLLGLLIRCPWKKLLIFWLIFTCGAVYWSLTDARNESRLAEILAVDSSRSGNGPLSEDVQVLVKGTLISAVEIDGDRADFTLRLDGLDDVSVASEEGVTDGIETAERVFDEVRGERLAVQVRLASIEEIQIAKTWQRGWQIEARGSLERPGIARNFGGFDYRNYLRNQRIHWILKAAGASSVEVAASHEFSPALWLGKVDAARGMLGNRIEQLFPEWQAGYMKGLLIGYASELEPDKYAQFSQLGLTHILAISGSHVAINVSLIFSLLRLCRVTRETSLRIVFCFVPLYVLITGFSPSVIRSGFMTMIGIYLVSRGLLKDGLNVLCAVALLMLLWEPYYLLNVSFQLSFIVTAGLILFVPLLLPYLSWLPAKLSGAAAITIAAQIVSFPLTIYYFNQFSLLSLAANMLLVPLIGMITLPAGTAALLLSALSLRLGTWLAYPVRLLNEATFIVTEWLNGRSGFMTYWKSPSILWIIVFYCAFYLLLSLRHRSRIMRQAALSANDDTMPLDGLQASASAAPVRPQQLLSAALAGLLLVQLYLGYQPLNVRGRGHVQFIDVGQGDCTLITTPEGKNILVDGGGTVSFRKQEDTWRNRRDPFEVGAKIVVPLLKKRGINRLDAVIVTHGDQDHAGGLQAVLEQFPIGALLMNGTLSGSATIDKLMSTAVSKQIPIYAAGQGMRLKIDSSTVMQFLSPEFQESGHREIPYIQEQNHESVVFTLSMAGATFLFTGDMDEAAEQQVLEGVDLQRQQTVDVMKVAHHGSKTSTSLEWLEYWQPASVVISAGASNIYGHPHPTVVERLESSGSHIFRTDQQGEVQIEVLDGNLRARFMLSTSG